MTQEIENQPKPNKPVKGKKAIREDKLAQALRDNLRRRKAINGEKG